MGRPLLCAPRQNLASEEAKICFSKSSFIIFLKNFLSFFGFSMVKIHFLQKVLKKWSSFRKKKKIFFPYPGGGSGPYMEFSIIFFFFFFNLPQREGSKKKKKNIFGKFHNRGSCPPPPM